MGRRTPLSTPEFTLRPLELADSGAMLDAVQANKERLQADFPHIVAGYSSTQAAYEKVATAMASEYLDVVVATDPDNTAFYGVGTRWYINAPQVAVTGLKRAVRLPGTIKTPVIVAGWTVQEHPSGLAVAGLKHLIDGGDETDTYDSMELYAAAALIRTDHDASKAVAEAAGMERGTNFFKRPATVSPSRLKIAGIGVDKPQELWVAARRPKRHWHGE